jgi:predicted porin
MKKSLFAVAALSAIAGAAQAQSSVTVYGILDVGYVGSNSRLANGSLSTVGNAPAKTVYKSTGNQFTSSSQQTSRLGFKGTEDMGGGVSAFFTLETTVTPNGTTAIGGTRQAFVGLNKNGLGAVSMGTQYTPVHIAVGATDPGQQNQMTGNVIYAAYNGPAYEPDSGASGNTAAYTTRTANQLKLVTDNFAGFKVTGILVANNQNNTQTTAVNAGTSAITGGLNNQNGWGLGVDYTWKKLLVTANYQSFTSKNPYTITNGATTTYTAGTPAVWSTATGGSNIQDNQTYVGATYDFGILKAYAQWSARKASSQQNSGYYVKRSAQQIGVRSFITPTIETWASVGNGQYSAYGAGNPTAHIAAFQLGSNYWLSKRTNLYAIYGQAGTSNVTVGTGGPVSSNVNAYALGVRHTF